MKVSLIIDVPDGGYCWGPPNHSICQYFDNYKGRARCALKIGDPMRDDHGGKKPARCTKLKKVTHGGAI